MSDAPVRPDWPRVPLADLAEVAAGVTLGRKLPLFSTVERPYLRVANVQDGYLDLGEIKTVRVRPGEVDRYGLQPNDVVLSEGNANINLLGRATLWTGEIPDCLHQNIVLRVRCDPSQLLPAFLVALTTARDFRRYVRAVAKQTSIAHLGITQLAAYPVPLPPLEVQQHIVDATAAAEEAADASRRLAAKLARVREGELQGLLAPAGAPLTREAGEWPRAHLSDVADVASGVTLGRKLPLFSTVELPYLRVANVQDGYLDLSEVKTTRVRPGEVDRYRLQRGDVLMNEGGDYDKLGRGTVWRGQIDNCLHQNHIFRVRVDKTRLLPEFLTAVCAAAYGRKYFLVRGKQSTNLASISKTDIVAMPTPLPSFDVQEQIVSTLARYDHRIRAEHARAEKHMAIRDGLLDEFLTSRRPAAA